VFFQKKVNGAEPTAKLPEKLELYESELREVVGGALRRSIGGALPTRAFDDIFKVGTTTYSGSAGWADVMQADDCA
jgi:hypothetical protein